MKPSKETLTNITHIIEERIPWRHSQEINQLPPEQSGSEQNTNETIPVGEPADETRKDDSAETRGKLARTREQLHYIAENAAEKAGEIGEKAKYGVVHAGQLADHSIAASRESRMRAEEENAARSGRERFFSSVKGKVIKTGIEMIPFPITVYGPGDVITALGALRGRDFLSGEKLDGVDRIIYAAATVVPFVPATPIIEVSKPVRRGIENIHHGLRNRDHANLHSGTQDIIHSVQDVRRAHKNRRMRS